MLTVTNLVHAHNHMLCMCPQSYGLQTYPVSNFAHARFDGVVPLIVRPGNNLQARNNRLILHVHGLRNKYRQTNK